MDFYTLVKKILTNIKNYTTSLINGTQDTLNQYRTNRKAAKSKPEVDHARDICAYDLLKLWLPKFVLPLCLIIMMMFLIKIYFIYILIIGYGVYYLQKHSVPIYQPDYTTANYIFVRDFIFNDLRSMSDRLMSEKPLHVTDIVHCPEVDFSEGFPLFLYKLRKLSHDQLPERDLEHAELIFRDKLEQELNRFEAAHQKGSTYYQDNTRKITLTDITDFGTYYLFQLAFVNSPEIHQYVNRRNISAKCTKPSGSTSAHDKDF